LLERTLVKLIASLALLVPAIAAAQPGAYGPPPPPPPGYYAQPVAAPAPSTERRGFLIGFSLGGGSITCDDCRDSLSGVALDIHLGGMIAPNLALMFDGMGVAHTLEEGNGTLIHVVDTIAAQYWVTPQFWIKGGVGIGRISVSDADGEEVAASETGSAAMFGVGYELVSSRTFALDLQLRGAVAHYDETDVQMGSLGLGINWY
jgi:hypothetical protein